MGERVLVVGGAGFIGRYVSAALAATGHEVRVLDSFEPQVHGRSAFQISDAEVIQGSVLDAAVLRKALRSVDSVIHLAADVGVGQSMYAVARYVRTNDLGTALLVDALAENPVRRLVVASSMSIYGEGLYRRADGSLADDVERADIGPGSWDPVDAQGAPLAPIPTPESKRPSLASVYALSKYVQERLTIMAAPASGIEGCALRLFNVYGPGQSLSNPYTGVLAIFASRILSGESPLVFEDGEQRRDFVHVEDVARAFVLALTRPEAAGRVLNIASGYDRSISDIASELAQAMGRSDLTPVILQKGRKGDVRHCFADITAAQRVLGFQPERNFGEGLCRLAEWAATQRAVDRTADAHAELRARGLLT